MRRRPEPFYGPDDHIEGRDPYEEEAEMQAEVDAWDEWYRSLSFWQWLRYKMGYGPDAE